MRIASDGADSEFARQALGDAHAQGTWDAMVDAAVAYMKRHVDEMDADLLNKREG
jgi:hypothetical protein